MIPIDFDKPRNLSFDLPAVRDLENAMNGQPLGAIVTHLSQMGVNAIVFSLWAGLKHEDRALTPRLVEKYLETYLKTHRLKTIATVLNDALEETGLFKTEDEEGNAPPEPTATTH